MTTRAGDDTNETISEPLGTFLVAEQGGNARGVVQNIGEGGEDEDHGVVAGVEHTRVGVVAHERSDTSSVVSSVTESLKGVSVERRIVCPVPVYVDEDGVLPDVRQIDTLVRNDDDGSTAVDAVDTCETLANGGIVKPMTRSIADLADPGRVQRCNVEGVRSSVVHKHTTVQVPLSGSALGTGRGRSNGVTTESSGASRYLRGGDGRDRSTINLSRDKGHISATKGSIVHRAGIAAAAGARGTGGDSSSRASSRDDSCSLGHGTAGDFDRDGLEASFCSLNVAIFGDGGWLADDGDVLGSVVCAGRGCGRGWLFRSGLFLLGRFLLTLLVGLILVLVLFSEVLSLRLNTTGGSSDSRHIANHDVARDISEVLGDTNQAVDDITDRSKQTSLPLSSTVLVGVTAEAHNHGDNVVMNIVDLVPGLVLEVLRVVLPRVDDGEETQDLS